MAKETVQAISWSIEGIVLVLVVVIAWRVWRMAKRSAANHKAPRRGR